MISPAISKDRGFTLIEVIVVIILVASIGGLGLYFGFDNFRAYSFNTDRDTLVSALQHARAQAMANICHGDSIECTTGKPFGVRIEADKYIIFEGVTYSANDPLNVKLEANNAIGHAGINEIVFEQLTGNAFSLANPEPWSVILTDQENNKTSTISINSEGRISWTN